MVAQRSTSRVRAFAAVAPSGRPVGRLPYLRLPRGTDPGPGPRTSPRSWASTCGREVGAAALTWGGGLRKALLAQPHHCPHCCPYRFRPVPCRGVRLRSDCQHRSRGRPGQPGPRHAHGRRGPARQRLRCHDRVRRGRRAGEPARRGEGSRRGRCRCRSGGRADRGRAPGRRSSGRSRRRRVPHTTGRQGHRPRHARRVRLGRRAVVLPRLALDQGEQLGLSGGQPELQRLRDPAGSARAARWPASAATGRTTRSRRSAGASATSATRTARRARPGATPAPPTGTDPFRHNGTLRR